MNAIASSVLDAAAVVVVGDTAWTTAYARALEAESEATVHRVSTAAAAEETLRETTVDCILTDYSLPEQSGIDLVRRIRDTTATLPVLLGTADGSEAVASEAIEAGVTDYIAADSTAETAVAGDALERTERALREAQRSTTQRERARQFDAIFHDTRSATWVLDPDGMLTRVNQAARSMVDADVDAVTYIGGNLAVGQDDFEDTRRTFREMGFDRVFDSETSPE